MIACLFYSFRRHLDRLRLNAAYWLFETGIYNIIEQFKHAKYNRLVRLLV